MFKWIATTYLITLFMDSTNIERLFEAETLCIVGITRLLKVTISLIIIFEIMFYPDISLNIYPKFGRVEGLHLSQSYFNAGECYKTGWILLGLLVQ